MRCFLRCFYTRTGRLLMHIVHSDGAEKAVLRCGKGCVMRRNSLFRVAERAFLQWRKARMDVSHGANGWLSGCCLNCTRAAYLHA